MSKTTKKMQAAYDHFAKHAGRLLVRKGATCTDGVYKLDTPGGTLTIRPLRNWLFCQFRNPLGGFIVTRGVSAKHSGKWNTNFYDNAATLKSETVLAGFEYDLDGVLGYKLTDAQREAIRIEDEARQRQAAAFDACIAAWHAGDRPHGDARLGPTSGTGGNATVGAVAMPKPSEATA